MNKCCDNEAKCEPSCSSEGCESESGCSAAEGCPIEFAADMWQESFMEAMREAQVEILKEKILKAHGPMMEQAADAFLESAMACWQSQIAKVRKQEASQAFKAKIRELWLAEKKG